MASVSLSPLRTAAPAQIAPLQLPVEPGTVVEPETVGAETVEAEIDEWRHNIFVRPMNKKMERIWHAWYRPSSPDRIITALEFCQQSELICSPIAERERKRMALNFSLLFD